MTTDSSNSKDFGADEPIAVERRKQAPPAQTTEAVDSLPPLQTSDKVTQYDARSEIRTPFKLIANIAADFLAGRELAWRLFLRNIRGLYRQTLLGLFWAFLPPIANTAIWIFLREAGVFELGDTQVNGTVYILSGMILWQAFIDAFQMPLDVLNKNRSMISKLNFPRESLLLVGIGEVLFDLAIRLLLLIPAFLIFQISIHWTILLAPFAILGLVLLGAGLGLLVMPFGSLYQDVGRFIGMVVPFWMIITPIIYVPLKTFPGSLLNWVNPASPLLLLARDWLLLGSSEHLAIGLGAGLLSLPIVLLGLIVYRISIPVLVERMSA
ncbi:MAG: lipopolysaccharide transport system permease protein [Mariniblastus sp.]|jgi:lipopolysaccharide transport system permease protein